MLEAVEANHSVLESQGSALYAAFFAALTVAHPALCAFAILALALADMRRFLAGNRQGILRDSARRLSRLDRDVRAPLTAELLIDERQAGRLVAKRLGIGYLCIMGLLLRAKQAGWPTSSHVGKAVSDVSIVVPWAKLRAAAPRC